MRKRMTTKCNQISLLLLQLTCFCLLSIIRVSASTHILCIHLMPFVGYNTHSLNVRARASKLVVRIVRLWKA
ncbi:uncharacterized protein F5147DRAFT_738374 [Suillus discolor]|uniref:Uncharacterized protein n=1 Tax=Suillus discolor TaxID=1912936 RepID=A0A9P7EQS4_9AGAM|nr:uncharacterized protein F5147DRAFT_738374 [Suillus discolor]KAG2080362.1 hypothetical protein F5147DRAFT_738374 [Suillus discolor]